MSNQLFEQLRGYPVDAMGITFTAIPLKSLRSSSVLLVSYKLINKNMADEKFEAEERANKAKL